MDARRWERVQEIFHEVLDTPQELRDALLTRLCGGDGALEKEVRALLAADAREAPELDTDADELLAFMEDSGPEDAGPAPSDPGLPDRLGPYRIVEELGRGGMGVVYHAVLEESDYTREVALKVIAESVAGTKMRDEAAARFRQEYRILAGLEHPGIGRLYDAGVTPDGRPYMAMERIRGTPIDRYCDDLRMDVAARLELFEQVAAAVDYAHRRLVVHRDLKPSNILVTDQRQVKLLDFGIAKVLPDPEATAATAGEDPPALTRMGRRILTPEYASPEQLRGEPLSTASDVFSLGVLLHELLTGRRPGVDRLTGTRTRAPSTTVKRPADGEYTGTEAPDPAELAARRGTTPERLARTLSGELDALLLTALRPEPEHRYPSAAALLDDLVRWREGRPLAARAPTSGYRLRKFVGRHRVPVAAALLVLLSLTTGLGLALRQARIARAERDVATAVSGFLEGIFEASNRLAPGERRDTLPVSAFLDDAAGSLETTLADQPLVQARMRRILGTVYENLGDYEAAEPLLTAVVDDAELVPEERRSALVSLARMEMGRSDYAGAEARYREALALAREAADGSIGGGPGANAPGVADLQLELAGALLNLGELDEAESLITAALAAREGTLGEDALAASGSLNMLGSLQYRQGRLEGALANMRRAVELVRTEVDPDHPQAAIMAQNLGLILLRSDRADEAEPVLADAVGALRRTMGEDFPYLGTALKAWANTLDALDRWDEAEPRFREALAHARRVTPGQEPEMSALLDYGRVLARRGRWEEGRAMLEEAHAMAERLGIPPAAAAAALALAQGHRAAGDEAAAARWEARAGSPDPGGP